jgi:hypothetical protein
VLRREEGKKSRGASRAQVISSVMMLHIYCIGTVSKLYGRARARVQRRRDSGIHGSVVPVLSACPW